MCQVDAKGEITFFINSKTLTIEEVKRALIFLPNGFPPFIIRLAEEQGYKVIKLAPEEK